MGHAGAYTRPLPSTASFPHRIHERKPGGRGHEPIARRRCELGLFKTGVRTGRKRPANRACRCACGASYAGRLIRHCTQESNTRGRLQEMAGRTEVNHCGGGSGGRAGVPSFNYFAFSLSRPHGVDRLPASYRRGDGCGTRGGGGLSAAGRGSGESGSRRSSANSPPSTTSRSACHGRGPEQAAAVHSSSAEPEPLANRT